MGSPGGAGSYDGPIASFPSDAARQAQAIQDAADSPTPSRFAHVSICTLTSVWLPVWPFHAPWPSLPKAPLPYSLDGPMCPSSCASWHSPTQCSPYSPPLPSSSPLPNLHPAAPFPEPPFSCPQPPPPPGGLTMFLTDWWLILCLALYTTHTVLYMRLPLTCRALQA